MDGRAGRASPLVSELIAMEMRTVAPGAAVESATWPPLRVVDITGWHVGLSGGFTRRANSVIVTGAQGKTANVRESVDTVESLYRADGGIARFRLSPGDAETVLGAELIRRGYRPAAATTVMALRVLGTVADIDAVRDQSPVSVATADAPDDAWLSCWLQTKAAGYPDVLPAARGVVTGVPARYLRLLDPEVAARGGTSDTSVDHAPADPAPVAVARVCRVGQWAGISCVAVAQAQRRRGWGLRVSAAAVREAITMGASHIFLQVEHSNGGAATLYRQLGCVPVDDYAYWEQPAG